MKEWTGGRRAFAALTFLLLAGGGVYFGLRREKTPSSEHPPSASQSASNVVLITIDTLRADALGLYGNREVSTPHLDRLAAEGLLFEDAHASNVVTLPSHANILTGLFPHQHGIRDNTGFRLDTGTATLATILSERGFATGAFVGAFPLDSRYGLDRGFAVYDDRYPPGSSPYDFEMAERPGTEVVEAARAWYERERGRKRFLWVHLYEPHAPYRPPPPFAERYAGDPYLGEVSAADAALEPLLSLVRRDSNTLVLVTSDHGEALGDHGELTHGLFAYEATLRVPLVLWRPASVKPGRSLRPARHVDILPTVLEAVDAPIPEGLPGRSLLPLPPGEGRGEGGAEASVTYFEALSASLNRGWAPLTGVVHRGFKYIDLPIPELYDLKADPEEKTNLFTGRRDIARNLKALIPEGARNARAAEPGSEEARRLLALGYLSGSGRQKGSYTKEDDPKRLVGLDAKLHRVIDWFQRGRVADATRLAREIVNQRPGMAVGYEFLGFLLQHAGRDREAAGVLSEASRKGLASEAMHVRLALILSEAGQAADALAVLRPLAGSSDPDTQNAIGIALADSGRTAEALAVFERVLAKDSGNATALQNMGIALLKAGKAPEALARFDSALAISDRLPRAFNARGVAQARMGDTAGALSSWRRAVELDPRQYDALFNIGIVAGQRGELAVARDALRRFVATAPPTLYGRDLAEARKMLQRMGG